MTQLTRSSPHLKSNNLLLRNRLFLTVTTVMKSQLPLKRRQSFLRKQLQSQHQLKRQRYLTVTKTTRTISSRQLNQSLPRHLRRLLQRRNFLKIAMTTTICSPSQSKNKLKLLSRLLLPLKRSKCLMTMKTLTKTSNRQQNHSLRL